MLERVAGALDLNDQSYPSTQSPIRQHRLFKMAELEIVKTPKRLKKQWKDEELKCLIENYEERPCLWDTFNKEYHNRDKRATALAELEQVLDVSKEEIISKWNTLRGQYSRELNLTSKTKSGSGLDERYESKWLYFQQMKFLQGVVEARKSTDTLSEEADNTSREGAEFFCCCL